MPEKTMTKNKCSGWASGAAQPVPGSSALRKSGIAFIIREIRKSGSDFIIREIRKSGN
jgi:hypothetical protein